MVCNGARVGEEILKQAEEKEIVIISSPHDAFTVARLINQSIPVKQFMTREGIVSFQMDDYVDDVKDVMARRRSVTSQSWMRQAISWDLFPEEDCSTAAENR